MKTQQEKIISKFEDMSFKYHKLSLLFYELSQSLKIENKKIGEHNPKGFREYLKTLNLDVEKIKSLSCDLSNISLNNLKGGED